MSKPPDFLDGARKVGQIHKPLIVDPSTLSEEERTIAMAQRVCGQCKHFDRATAQAEMQATRFLEQLTEEYEWQIRHLAAPANQLGFCGAYNAGTKGEQRTLTALLNNADTCEAFRPHNGLVTLRRSRDRED